MYNKMTVVGRLGAEPESKTHGSLLVCTFSVATNENWLDKKSGEKKTKTQWHRVTCFNQLGKIAQEFLRKGSLVLVEGSIRSDEYTDKEGVNRSTVSIIARELKMLDKAPPEKQGTNSETETHSGSHMVEDLPF